MSTLKDPESRLPAEGTTAAAFRWRSAGHVAASIVLTAGPARTAVWDAYRLTGF